ncbi:uncharacterized protein FIESC28_01304 [Fusarium coffeatum]|uniref:RING-type domain-containing protein n=1 Tax=Fusarium coffeatum TaxID=231269 RepID=A0A366S9P5_9HYPO|nr:uncharacterized protein FIESC28_01304 [Fusarium coffeatum]RBR26031.1 hypothetical protein FIESC28_01304 [Fusarium coffeatum]
MSLFQRLFPFLRASPTRPGGLNPDESRILALSIARAVEADAAILEQYRREDQVARDRMIAQAQNEHRKISIEPLIDQPVLDEATLNELRRLNPDASDDSESEGDSIEEAEELVDEKDEDVEVIEHADNTGDTQDTHEAEYTPDNTEDTDDAPEIETPRQQPGETASSQATTIEQEEVVDHVDTVDQRIVHDQQGSQEPPDLVALPEPASPAIASSSATPPAPERKQCMAVELSMREESMFPPQCCQQAIPIEVGAFISQEIFDRFQEKTTEFGTVDRTYCSDTACSAFITPQSIAESEGIARCSRCELQTCPICKRAWHEGACPEDEKTQELVRLGEREGWKRCESCKHLIQRSTGCNQMTCRCGHKFCYLCAAKWKSCSCPYSDFVGLLGLGQPAQAAANNGQLPPAWLEPEVPRREPVPRPAPVPPAQRPRETPDQEAARRRRHRERHELFPDCQHRRWRTSRGEWQSCDDCGQFMQEFVFTCRDCDMDACGRCRDTIESWQ